MKQIDNNIVAQEEKTTFLDAYRKTLPAVIRHPATWLLTFLWLVAAAYLLAIGKVSFTTTILVMSPLIFALLTIPLTQGAPPAPWTTPVSYSRTYLWLQVVLTLCSLMVVAFFTIFNNLHTPIPLIDSYYAVFHASTLFRATFAIIFELIIPLGLALLLGARWREMGFQKGYHTWRVTILWSALPFLTLIIAIISGKITLLAVLLRIILLLFLAALPEEIGMRGILMTRLMRLLGTGWGIAISAVFFGLLHLGVDITQTGSTSVPIVLALAIYSQMSGGVFFAIMFQRTRSLIPGIISHVLSDAISFS